MSKSTDRIIDLIDAGLGSSFEAGYSNIDPEGCARCGVPPDEGSEFCGPCRAFLLGDGPEPTRNKYRLGTFSVGRELLDDLAPLNALRGGIRFTTPPNQVGIGSPSGHLHLELEMPPRHYPWVWDGDIAALIGTLFPFDHHLHFTVAKVQLEDWDYNWIILTQMVQRHLFEYLNIIPKVVRLTVEHDGGFAGGINVTLEWSSCDPAFVEHSERRDERHLAERYDDPLPPWWTESTI